MQCFYDLIFHTLSKISLCYSIIPI